jgi:WD40 repeat protein
VAVAPDGRGLVCGGYGCPVRWIGLTDPRRQRTMEGSQRLIHVVRFSADGQRVCAVEGTLGTTMAFQEWDLATGQLIRRLPKIYLAVPLPDGRRLLGVPTTARTRLAEFDLDTQQMVGGRAMEHPALLTTLETDRAGRWALTGCADGPDHRIRLWDVAAGRLVRTWDGPLGYYGAVALAADGSRAAWGEPDRIVVWDLAGDRAWHALPRPDGTRFDIRGLAFTADGRLVTSTGPREGLSGGAVSVWDLATGRLLATTATTSVRCLAVTPDGRRAVTGHYDGTLHFWRLPQAPGK